MHMLPAVVFVSLAMLGVASAASQSLDPPRRATPERQAAELLEPRQFTAQPNPNAMDSAPRAERARMCEDKARQSRRAGDDLRVFMIKCMNTR